MENFEPVGLQLPLLVAFFAFLGIAALGVVFTLLKMRNRRSDWEIGAGISFIIAAIPLLIWVVMLVPFDSKYHHIYRVSGEVTSVSNVLDSAGGELTRTPVLTLDGVDRDITMDDPRAVNLLGKDVELTCSVSWSYQGADKYSCKIYAIEEAA